MSEQQRNVLCDTAQKSKTIFLNIKNQIIMLNIDFFKKIQELPEEKWTVEGDEQYIQCSECKSSEGLPLDEQRHHLTTTFTVKSEDASNIIIECECGKVFKTKK